MLLASETQGINFKLTSEVEIERFLCVANKIRVAKINIIPKDERSLQFFTL